MAWGIEHFDYYLRGRKFKVRTDHSALTAIKTNPFLESLRLERMRERLGMYDFDIYHKKGSSIVEADAPSRLYEQADELTELELKSKKVLKDGEGEYYWIETQELI